MKTKGSVYNAHLDFRGKICEKKCALYTGKYGILFCFVSSIMGVNLYMSFQNYRCFWLEKRGSTYTRIDFYTRKYGN